MVKKSLMFCTLVLLFYGYRVDALELKKCSIKNSTCLLQSFQGVATRFGRTGIPEIGIETIVPYKIINATLKVLEFLNMKMSHGYAYGIDTCRLIDYETDLKNFTRTIEIICKRVVIQGSYSIWTDPFFTYIFCDVSGYGNGTIVLDDWYFLIKYPFEFVRRKNGQIYFNPKFHEGSYVSEIRTKATVSADRFFLNNRDVTTKFLRFINKYWRIIFNDYFSCFHKLSMYYYQITYGQFYKSVSATEYLSDDLNPFLAENRLCKS